MAKLSRDKTRSFPLSPSFPPSFPPCLFPYLCGVSQHALAHDCNWFLNLDFVEPPEGGEEGGKDLKRGGRREERREGEGWWLGIWYETRRVQPGEGRKEGARAGLHLWVVWSMDSKGEAEEIDR